VADYAIPLIIAGPIAAAMSTAIGALWVKVVSDGRHAQTRQRDWDTRERELQERNAELEREKADALERITREVKRGAWLYAMNQLEPPKQSPELPPAPDWEENTDVRNVRRQAELEALFRAYRESTPPRPYRGKLPSSRG
jgi:hypothetical protein